MKNYPKEKYQIIVHQNSVNGNPEVIAISTYAGKVVKGKAKCHANDTFNEAKGAELAIARCAAKIAKKRQARADRLVAQAQMEYNRAKKFLDKMNGYKADASEEVGYTQAAVEALEKNLND